MEAIKDEKDNKPRRSQCLFVCLPMILALFFAIIFVPMGILFLKPHIEACRHQNLAAASALMMESPKPVVEAPVMFDSARQLGGYQGSALDKRTWLDFKDFNTTFTTQMIAGLPIMGLFSSWIDRARANPHTPSLTKSWEYGVRPIRGVSLDGWLALDPRINEFLGNKSEAEFCGSFDGDLKQKLETHYMSFVTEDDFLSIANAGIDHVRIPIGHWIISPVQGEPYLNQVGWRYFLRGMEWARKNGLRVQVDLASASHIKPIDGTLGALHRLASFLSQERYSNLVTMISVSKLPDALGLHLDDGATAFTHLAKTAITSAGFSGKVVVPQASASDAIVSVQTRLEYPGSYQEKMQHVCRDFPQQLSSIGGEMLVVDWTIDNDAPKPLANREYRAFLKDFSRGQVAVYEQFGGWFTRWSTYEEALEWAVVPNFNASHTKFTCDASTNYTLVGLF